MTATLKNFKHLLSTDDRSDIEKWLPKFDEAYRKAEYVYVTNSDDYYFHLDTIWYQMKFGAEGQDYELAIRFSKHHDGLDLYAPIGTQVYACVDGEIHEDYVSNTYGNTLGIKGIYNGTTYYFFYAHLSERDFAKSDKVSVGDPIGKTGQSGNASGQSAKMNHLHFEVRTSSGRTGGRIDPIATIAELKRDVITNPDEESQTGS